VWPNEADLAKQLFVYADSVTAFAAVQCIAFSFALANGGLFAESILKVKRYVTVAIIGAALFYSLLVYLCNQALVGLWTTATTAPSDTVFRMTTILCWFRIFIIVLTSGLSLTALRLTVRGSIQKN
jgi:hypothetical protein